MINLSAPFPLDGGRVGVGGARAGFAEDGAKGFDDASRAPADDAGANTPSQPSPVEGEGSCARASPVPNRRFAPSGMTRIEGGGHPLYDRRQSAGPDPLQTSGS